MIKIEIQGAPCQRKGVDPDLFFPDPTDREKIHEAKSLCAQCDTEVKAKCLDFSLRNSVQYGIFGGLTEQERNNLRRRENRKYRQYVSVVKDY